MKILSIQKHYNASVCFLNDGKLVYYGQEERLSRIKKDNGIPINCLRQLEKICDEFDTVVLTGYHDESDENFLILRYLCKIGFKFKHWFCFNKSHHLSHAAKAFYSSGFDEAMIVVSDGRGSSYTLNDGSTAYETTSVFMASYPCEFRGIYKRLYTSAKNISKNIGLWNYDFFENVDIKNNHDIGHFYEFVSRHLGFGVEESGKMMGLQSYGSYNEIIPKLTNGIEIHDDIFMKETPQKINEKMFPMLMTENYNQKTSIDFSFHAQEAFQDIGLNRIERMIEKTNCKNLILTGGTALNVVANNFFRKRISPRINLYIEPLCGDEGNSIGSAQLYFYEKTRSKSKTPLADIYLGMVPNYVFSLNEKELCFDGVTKQQISQLIIQGNIVSIFQGRSEGGPRALGNRSILFDPRVKNGKDIVNVVKKREWFRPFACSILLEHSRNWFDMHHLDESPYMMYALDALPGIKEKIPAVVHVDNTCRVQTVTREQNEHFYDLIEEFYKNTGVPLLLNTSFNLAGDPLVETIEDALNTLRKSELEYLYLPEIGKLIYIKNENKQLKQGD